MITLASDFGTPYPAAMKGVICQRTETRLVDVAHDFPRQDVRSAAFWLREVLPYFPPATHLVVVDPGVGTDRNAIAITAGNHALVGPDNGVLMPAARQLAPDSEDEDTGEDAFDVFVIDEAGLGPVEPTAEGATATKGRLNQSERGVPTEGPASNTFHGRDVFAPAAADVHEVGRDPAAVEYCEPTADYVDLVFPEPTIDDDRAVGEVLVVDDFGNAITNVPGPFLGGLERITANGEPVPVGDTFAAVDVGERLATVGSHGYVELDVNQGRGDEAFGLAPGDRVALEAINETGPGPD